MRLWHQRLIHYLPRQQLLGQHRECCALRGKGWGKKHSVVNYVFEHPYSWLFYYHRLVLCEMSARGYKFSYDWACENYRGASLLYTDPNDPFVAEDFVILRKDKPLSEKAIWFWFNSSTNADEVQLVYPEHDDAYLLECINNLRSKGIELINGKSLNQFELQATVQNGLLRR